MRRLYQEFLPKIQHSYSSNMDRDCVGNEIDHICEIVKNRLYFMTTNDENRLKNGNENVYFTCDNELHYHNYYCDFGPLNISCLYKYCCKLSSYLQNYVGKRIVHYTSVDVHKRANAACLIGSYSVIYLGLLPKEIYKLLISNNSAPYRPYIDASQGGSSGYTIRLIDVLQAVYKARMFGFFNFDDFDVNSYDSYDTLKNGDLNWLLPRKFLAFIGPIDNAAASGMTPGYNCHAASFYVNYFLNNDVRTVIRLNNKLYEESIFTDSGISHYDLFFTDGSSPPKEILIQFLHIVENSRGAIAVHCKAGLGRTGSLIGAYLVKHYRMTAREAIGWLRLCRPGCVIGQQQGWLEKIEKWLWRQGSSYRLEHFGEGDRIPHHRYGIYSLKWREHRSALMRQAANMKHQRETAVQPQQHSANANQRRSPTVSVNSMHPTAQCKPISMPVGAQKASPVYQQFMHTVTNVTNPENVHKQGPFMPRIVVGNGSAPVRGSESAARRLSQQAQVRATAERMMRANSRSGIPHVASDAAPTPQRVNFLRKTKASMRYPSVDRNERIDRNDRIERNDRSDRIDRSSDRDDEMKVLFEGGKVIAETKYLYEKSKAQTQTDPHPRYSDETEPDADKRKQAVHSAMYGNKFRSNERSKSSHTSQPPPQVVENCHYEGTKIQQKPIGNISNYYRKNKYGSMMRKSNEEQQRLLLLQKLQNYTSAMSRQNAADHNSSGVTQGDRLNEMKAARAHNHSHTMMHPHSRNYTTRYDV